MVRDLAIIGGGAAGLAASIAAASQLRPSGGRVRLFEADERVGRSILETGNGRCNFSNTLIDPSFYNDPAFVEQVLTALRDKAGDRWACQADGEKSANEKSNCEQQECKAASDPVLSFFEWLGLDWRKEAEGRLYPLANKASSLLDVLRIAATTLGVEFVCQKPVESIEAPRDKGKAFVIHCKDGAWERAEGIIVAVGGRRSQRLLPEDVPFHQLRPMLGPLKTDHSVVSRLNNIRVKAQVTLLRDQRALTSESGEVLFRDYGVSGIAIFNLSRFAQSGDVLQLDLLPTLESDELEAIALRRLARLQSWYPSPISPLDYLRGLILPQIAEAFLNLADLSERDSLDGSSALRLLRTFKSIDLPVEGIAEKQKCQIHRGGVGTSALDPESLQVKATPGLYVAGEMVDIDGPCGGFNLHWAWASGLLAGLSAADCGSDQCGSEQCGNDQGGSKQCDSEQKSSGPEAS